MYVHIWLVVLTFSRSVIRVNKNIVYEDRYKQEKIKQRLSPRTRTILEREREKKIAASHAVSLSIIKYLPYNVTCVK